MNPIKNYIKNYIKYDTILKKLNGVANVPNELPETQSWIYMPLILMPFNDVNVNFPDYFNDLGIPDFLVPYDTLGFFYTKLLKYYEDNNINLDDRKSLNNLNYHYDDANFLHLTPNDQEKLLDVVEIRLQVDAFAETLVNNFNNTEFTFEKKQ